MKRLLLVLLLSGGLCAASFAQVAPATPAAVKEHKKSTGVTKSGKPDMRLKANRDAAKAQVQPAAPAPAPSPRPVVARNAPRVAPAPAPRPAMVQKVQPAVVSADPVAGTDAKGRTIYRGKRGGTYYINKNGHKEYVKQ
ncbi:hypothetical protein LL912_25615 [Niabella sp. CC-SYL272]|uniref:hypothetical protein n=1 Tax=Niabella agricola TaxID=2891571 RepID=UPI001F453994|nr:hypothetical protein [Niabella agricola]MCF3112192.1 hypothetical protein [Niabella agricola]